MKKTSSIVWKFFDRIIENSRCVSVVCKLCECQYKFFGNTTNLRVHLINKHPIQWELTANGTDTSVTLEDALAAGPATSTPTKRRRNKRSSAIKNVCNLEVEEAVSSIIDVQPVDIDQNSDTDAEEDKTTINLVRQMHGEQQSDEEWLDEDAYQITHFETYEPKPKRKRKYRSIKREVPSPTGLPGYYTLPKTENIIYEDTTPKDEYSIFGEYVANKIRKIKAPRTRGNLQQLITTILWQAEYGLYESADTVRKVLLMNIAHEAMPQNSSDIEQIHTVQAEEIIHDMEHLDNDAEDHQSGGSVSVILN